MRSDVFTNHLLGCLLAGTAFSGAFAVEMGEDTEALGETARRLQLAYARLCSGPLNDLGFVLADLALDRDRRFTEYSGDISGRMLGALHSASPVLGRETGLLDELIVSLPQYQKEDGHFGCEQDLSHLEEKRDMPILWGNGRLLLALAQRCRDAPNESLLCSAKRLGEYVLRNRDVYGKRENFESVGGIKASGFTTCYPSLIQGLVVLGQVTGDARYWEEAAYIGRLSLADEAFQGRHSHGRLVAYCGLLDLDACRGTDEFLEAVRDGCERIAENYAFPTGGIPEYFDQEYNRDEGCSEADWVRVHFLLWLATADAFHLDAAEHVLRNHLLPLQYPNGGFGHGLFPAVESEGHAYRWARIAPVGSDSYWCCSMHCTELLADTCRWTVLKDAEGFRVTWLAEGRSRFFVGKVPVQFTVEEPFPLEWHITVDSNSQSVRFPLYLRAPGWMKRMLVDGREIEAERDWVKLDREWKGKTECKVLLEGGPRFSSPYAFTQEKAKPGTPCRLFWGPDLYGLPQAWAGEGRFDSTTVPTVLLSSDRRPRAREGWPALLKTGKDSTQRCRLVRMLDRPRAGIHFLLDGRMMNAVDYQKKDSASSPMPERGCYLELEFGCQGTCDLYVNGRKVRRQQGYHEAAQAELFVPPGPQRVEILLHSEGSGVSKLIGTVRSEEGLIAVTGQNEASLLSVNEGALPLYFEDPERVESAPGQLSILGDLGDKPWGWHPGELMGAGARWIGPEAPPEKGNVWVVRFDFEVVSRDDP